MEIATDASRPRNDKVGKCLHAARRVVAPYGFYWECVQRRVRDAARYMVGGSDCTRRGHVHDLQREKNKKSRGGEGSPLREFFKEALQLRPEFRREIQQRSDKALAIGFVRFRHKLIDHEGKLLVHGTLYLHVAGAVAQPRLRDVEFAADVRDRAVAGLLRAGADAGNERLAQMKLFRKFGLGQAGALDYEGNPIPYRLHWYHLPRRE